MMEVGIISPVTYYNNKFFENIILDCNFLEAMTNTFIFLTIFCARNTIINYFPLIIMRKQFSMSRQLKKLMRISHDLYKCILITNMNGITSKIIMEIKKNTFFNQIFGLWHKIETLIVGTIMETDVQCCDNCIFCS